MIFLYKNNASSTLQSGINGSALSAVLASGTGALFPQPVPGVSGFYLTLLDAATELVNEIVLVTARTGDAITIVRAQQGTTARAWAAGDIAAQLWTKGDTDEMVQPDQVQENTYGSCHAGGSVNSITAQIPSGLTTIPDLMPLTIRSLGANTGNVTVTVTLGSTVQPATPVVKAAGSQLNANDIPGPDYPIELVYIAARSAFIMTNPGSGTAGSIAGGAANQVLYQTAPGSTGFVPAPTVSGQVLAFVGGVLTWLVSAVTSFNGRGGAVVPQSGDYTAAQVGAVATGAFQGPNVQIGNPMFFILPNGCIHQAGRLNVTPNFRTVVTFPKFYPSQCVSIVASSNNAASAINVENLGQGSFAVTVNATQVNWMSDGF